MMLGMGVSPWDFQFQSIVPVENRLSRYFSEIPLVPTCYNYMDRSEDGMTNRTLHQLNARSHSMRTMGDEPGYKS